MFNRVNCDDFEIKLIEIWLDLILVQLDQLDMLT
jgi:hypothetical protein